MNEGITFLDISCSIIGKNLFFWQAKLIKKEINWKWIWFYIPVFYIPVQLVPKNINNCDIESLKFWNLKRTFHDQNSQYVKSNLKICILPKVWWYYWMKICFMYYFSGMHVLWSETSLKALVCKHNYCL